MCGDEPTAQVVELFDSGELGSVGAKAALGEPPGVHVAEIRGRGGRVLIRRGAGWRRSARWPVVFAARRRRLIHITHAKSGRQIRQIAKMLERLRVGQRIDVLHRQPVDHIAHGKLGNLPRQRARQVSHRNDFRRHMARRRMGADRVANLLSQRLVELDVRLSGARTTPPARHSASPAQPQALRRLPPAPRPRRRSPPYRYVRHPDSTRRPTARRSRARRVP